MPSASYRCWSTVTKRMLRRRGPESVPRRRLCRRLAAVAARARRARNAPRESIRIACATGVTSTPPCYANAERGRAVRKPAPAVRPVFARRDDLDRGPEAEVRGDGAKREMQPDVVAPDRDEAEQRVGRGQQSRGSPEGRRRSATICAYNRGGTAPANAMMPRTPNRRCTRLWRRFTGSKPEHEPVARAPP